MRGAIRLFVSSSPELAIERAVVGQVVASLPLTLGWRIVHTSLPGEPASVGGFSRASQCDLYTLILGHDFSAPMGAELRQARAAGQKPLAFRLKCTHSPSAQDAIRSLDVDWCEFTSAEELRSLFARDLLQAVLQQATRLGLQLTEVERLFELARESEREEVTSEDGGRRREEAGHSGVILGREVWESEGRDRR